MFEGVDKEKNKDQIISTKEKALLLAGYSVGRLILRKIRKAKTYGDLNYLMDKVADPIEESDNDLGEKGTYSLFNKIADGIR